MGIHYKTEVLALSARKYSDNHKIVTLMTPGEGVVDAFIYGVSSRRNRALTSLTPFCNSDVDLYFDKTRERWRVSEHSGITLFEGIHKSLKKFYIASLWAEVVIKLHGGGVARERFFQLLKKSFTLLEKCCDTPSSEKLSLLFLWKSLILSGVAPHPEQCSECSREPKERPLYYNAIGGFLCEQCTLGRKNQLPWESNLYLQSTKQALLEEGLERALSSDNCRATEQLLLNILMMSFGITQFKSYESRRKLV